MNRYILIPFLSVCLNATAARVFSPEEVPWVAELQARKVFFFHVCGSSKIRPTKKSLNQDFALGTEKQGFFFTEMPGLSEYDSTLRTQGMEQAKNSLRARFEKAHLWRHSEKDLTDLGAPTKIELPFQATVKDCLEGSKNSLGIECTQPRFRSICCAEKFAGPTIYWGSNQEYVLKFSPDPSVKLKVPGEHDNRYCNFQQINEVAGSGR